MLLFQSRKQRELGRLPGTGATTNPDGTTTVEPRAVLIDAVLDSELYYSRTITEHPVEIGKPVADHTWEDPARYGLRGAVSDVPVTWARTTYGQSDESTRSASAFQLIKQLFENDEPFDLQTERVLLKNMLIESISFPNDKSLEGTLLFFASLREVQLVEVARDSANAASVLGTQARSQGTPKAEREVEPIEVDSDSSFGAKLLDFNAKWFLP